MSFTQDKITNKYINGSLRESNSVYYGEIVGKGSAICSFENTVNIRIFKGNNKLDASKDGEVLKNVPFLVSSSTVAPKWEVGETVVVGFLNSDANSPYVIVKNTPFSKYTGPINDLSDANRSSVGIDFKNGDEYNITGFSLDNGNAAYIFKTLIANGATIAGACGVLGNIQAESGFSTTLNSGDYGTSGGLCQWHLSRQTGLINYCNDRGYSSESVEGQTAWLLEEMTTSYVKVWNKICSADGEQGAYDAAYLMCTDFEAPADTINQAIYRGGIAKAIFKEKVNGVRIEKKSNKSSDFSGYSDNILQELKSTKDWGDIEKKCAFIDSSLVFTTVLENRDSTSKIILHHDAENFKDAIELHNYHINDKQYSGIGYHFFINKQGQAYIGRPIDKIGAHCLGQNGDSIGICFQGNYQNVDNAMPSPQLVKGLYVIKYILNKYGNLSIKKHSDFCSTACPGKNFPFNQIIGYFN